MNGYQTSLKSVDHLYIQNEKSIIDCVNYFSNATKLTFENNFSTTRDSIPTTLNRIIPLKQLTQLVIKCHHFSLVRLIELLSSTPNIHTLIFESMPFYKNDYTTIQENENFRLLSSTNIMRDVTFKEKCTLEKLKILVALCPRVQHLTIYTFLKDMQSITRFILKKPNQNTDNLHSLCFLRASVNYSQNFETLVTREALISDYMLKLVGSKLSAWW